MKKIIVGGIVAIVALGFIGCGGGGGGGGGGGTTTTALKGLATCAAVADEAVICGAALAPDGKTPIVGAQVVRVTSSAMVVSLKGLRDDGFGKLAADDTKCETDATGAFACSGEMPDGNNDFRITSNLFTIDFNANTTTGDVAVIPTADTTASKGSATGRFAVVMGAFDSIENVLARVLGCGTVTGGELQIGTECPQIELIDATGTNPNTALTTALGLTEGTYPTLSEFLNSGAQTDTALALFDGIFFNCGMGEAFTSDTTVLAALKNYVSNGGNLYASDWAYEYLENAWSDAIDWYGDDTLDEARAGNSNSAQPVEVNDAGLLAWLQMEGLIPSGATTFNVNFNLGSWVVMVGAGTGTTEILSTESLASGVGGEIPYSHHTPITVDFPHGSGCVFYTSYHNEPASEVSTEDVQARVLEYLLLNKFGNCGS